MSDIKEHPVGEIFEYASGKQCKCVIDENFKCEGCVFDCDDPYPCDCGYNPNPCPQKCADFERGDGENVMFVEVDDKNQMVSIDKVLELYENELKEFRCLLDMIKKGAGEVVNIEKSVSEFKKKLEE